MNMNEQTPYPENELPSDWLFDEISESRTVPAFWDVSELASSKEPSQGEALTAASPPTEGNELGAAQSGGDGAPEWYRNPFPEPRTFPVYWDLYR